MSVRSTHNHIGRVVAVVVAGTVFGVAGTVALTAAARPAQLAPHHHYAEFAALADWAKAHHLAGLSPASLAATNRDLNAAARQAADLPAFAEFADLSAFAEFADAEGLSGLSPASLHPVDD